jgi:hypothetical protein
MTVLFILALAEDDGELLEPSLRMNPRITTCEGVVTQSKCRIADLNTFAFTGTKANPKIDSLSPS